MPKIFRQVIRAGELRLEGPGGFVEAFGSAETGPSVTIRITDPKVDRRILASPELAVAEAYMDGTLQVKSGGADEFLELIYLNIKHYWDTPIYKILGSIAYHLQRLVYYNPVSRARRNARHHYDTGNAFYRKWLDNDMQYSCAYFPSGDESLDRAQLAKKRHIAAKLGLKPGLRVLDIGCGWGGMALYLASVEEVEVLGVTLSEEQLKIARARADALGLSNRVRFELRDYRELTESFDRIVSVGMLEHVGYKHLDQYFAQVRERLTADGVALIHTISTLADKSFTGS
ncbi:MAG: SAM-dependent methyltransferase, partial [Gammaproteobacteria bacterium]